MAKLSKNEGVKIIIAELKKGKATNQILGVIRSKSELSNSTFFGWLKTAKEQHEAKELKLSKVVEGKTIAIEIDAKIKAINDANERKAILQEKFVEVSKIKRGEIIVQAKGGKKETVKVTLAEEMKAIELLAKIDDRLSKADGTDKPSKVASTDPDGNEQKPTMGPKEVADVINELRKK